MSKKSLAWSVLIIAGVFVIGSALTFGPEAWGGPRDGNRDIQPGGWPAKVRMYHAVLYGEGSVELIPTVEGPNGFMITGIYVDRGLQRCTLSVDGSTYADFRIVDPQLYVEPKPGIPVAAGSNVLIYGSEQGGYTSFTVTGYVY